MKSQNQNDADTWRTWILAHQSSGLSIRGWCRANQCAEPAFYWWRRKLGLSPGTGKSWRRRSVKPSGFAEVKVVDSTPIESIRLMLGHGRELILPSSMPLNDVAMLIRAIEGAA